MNFPIRECNFQCMNRLGRGGLISLGHPRTGIVVTWRNISFTRSGRGPITLGGLKWEDLLMLFDETVFLPTIGVDEKDN